MQALTTATAALLKPLHIASNDFIELSLDDEGGHFTATIFSKTPHGRGQPSHNAQFKFLERIPEKKELKGDRLPQWKLAATDYTSSIISHVWPKEQVLFKEEKARGVYDYLNLTVKQEERCAVNYAQFKEHQEATLRARALGMNKTLWAGYAPQLLSDVNGDETLHSEFPLRLHQRVARRNAQLSDGFGLFMEQGTGKTPVGVSLICDEAAKVFADAGRMYRAIVVCPNAVRLNWVKEFQRFATVPGDVSVVRGNLVTRYEQFINAMIPSSPDSQFTVVVCGYETLRLTWELIETFPWDLAMLDESHAIKWPETQRAKYSFKLRDISQKRVVLTGTPVANSPLDIYAQFEFMQKGGSGFASWKEFRSFYGVFAKDEDGKDSKKGKLVALQNMPFMKERLTRKAFLVTKEQVLPDLPKKVYDVVEVEMGSRQAEVYEQVSTQLALEIENDIDNAGPNKQLTINNVLTKLLRLAQITSGFVTYDKLIDADGNVVQPSTTEFFVPNVKLDMLVEILKEKGPLSKTLIWSNWVPDLLAIKARLDMEGLDFGLMYGQTKQVDRDEAERRLNEDPKCRGLIANAAVAGAGLNFLGYPPHHPELAETNVDHHIVYAQDWSRIKRDQLEDRSHRDGTRVQQRYTDLVVPESIDETIRARVVEKKAMALELSDIREILMSVKKAIK